MNIDPSKLQSLKNTFRKPHVNSICIGCSACVAISGNVFELDDEGLSRVLKTETYEGHDVDDAIVACPVNAISWQQADENGEYMGGIVEHMDI